MKSNAGLKWKLGLFIISALILLVLGSFPMWPYSAGWGYYPSGIGLIVLIILAAVLLRAV